MIEFFQDIKVPITIAHVISVVFGMGAALVADILFSFFSKDKKLNKTEIATLSTLSITVSYSLLFIALTGIALFFSDPQKYISSTKFLSKMSILGILLINGYFLNKRIWPHLLNKTFFTLKRERIVRKYAFVCGAVSVISWLSVCALGVMDSVKSSYILLMSMYTTVLLCGIVVALLVEKRQLD